MCAANPLYMFEYMWVYGGFITQRGTLEASKDARSTQMNLHPCVAASVLRTSDPLPLTPQFT